MKLSYIFEQLQYGVLAGTSMGDGGIQRQDYPKIISQVNMALTELHTYFRLKNSEVVIDQFDHIATYQLDSRYAQTNKESDEKYKYIADSEFEPFTDNVLAITSVCTEAGEPLSLNEASCPLSITTPTPTSIQSPIAAEGVSLIVKYVANSVKIPLDTIDIENYEVDLPVAYINPLTLYVAHLVLAGSGTELSVAESNNFLSKYHNARQLLKERGTDVGEHIENLNLERNGWV